jgi:integral membrane protein (TIGR01906 family)
MLGPDRLPAGLPARTRYHRQTMDQIRGTLAALLTGVCATLVILALAILPLLSPAWIGFAQSRAQAEAWTGFSTDQLRTVTEEVVADLVVGPPAFDVALDGAPVLTEAERGHMRDVRGVFVGFFAVAAAAGIILGVLFAAARGSVARRRFWRRLERTGIAIVAVTVVGGLLGVLLFDAAFTLFHQLFFPGGNWQFDPRTDRLVQLFPQTFWVESTIAAGVLVIGLAVAMTAVARWRGRALSSRAGLAAALGTRTAPAR